MTGSVIAHCLMVSALVACVGLIILIILLQLVFSRAPILSKYAGPPLETSLTVVIPAYNEANNIQRCLKSVLSSACPSSQWHVLVVDDDSNDETASLAKSTAASITSKASFEIMKAGKRPGRENWVGKNWACARAMENVTSEWVLFLDADVQLAEQTILRAIVEADAKSADLLSLAPRLICSCIAEWMIQPIMGTLLGIGFPIIEANDPKSSVAFAAGPFMLFRKEVYNKIGGHSAIASEVVEDLALARIIKQKGHRLIYLIGIDDIDLYMYKDFESLWEGWTKNWFIGLDRSIIKAASAGILVLIMFSLPWLTLPIIIALAFLSESGQNILLITTIFSLSGISLQLVLRLWTQRRFNMPIDYWWLMGAGGVLIAAISFTSIWKTLTGRNWTWKGRSLNYSQ